jgi:hypothetical protein
MESPRNDGTRFQKEPTSRECNVAYASTGQYGGMVVAMADASGRFISPLISNGTWFGLCTPSGGETIGQDF